MTRRTKPATSVIAWAPAGASFTALALAVGLTRLYGPDTPVYEYWLESLAGAPVFATVGAVIVARRPRNTIGWILSAGAICAALQFLLGQFATLSLADRGASLPAAGVAGWASSLMQTVVVGGFLFLILLFPDGRPLSPRWAAVAWGAAAGLLLLLANTALAPGRLESLPLVDNPFGLRAAERLIDLVGLAGGILLVTGFVAALVSLVLRFRRSHGEEREQLKWFAYAAVLGIGVILGGSVLAPRSVDEQVGSFVWLLGPLGLPVATGLAITKYRLFDIDRIINRTLVYGALTATLFLAYFGLVLVIQDAFPQAISGSSFTVAVSTLAIAALFRPARAGIQRLIDRRFYRSKYDATRTIDAFSARLRDEVDLDTVTVELVDIIRRTMDPDGVALWLRPTQQEGPRPESG